MVTGLVLLKTDLPYIYRWNREGRKGQPCRLLVRGKMNSILVEFADGHRMVTSVNAIRTNRHSTDEVLATRPVCGQFSANEPT
jgi:hypothetical protein